MATVTTIAQKSKWVFGELTVPTTETLPLTAALFSSPGTAPNQCRGVEITLKSGTAKLVSGLTETIGRTLVVGVPFADTDAANLDGWHILNTGATDVVLEIACRTGGIS